MNYRGANRGRENHVDYYDDGRYSHASRYYEYHERNSERLRNENAWRRSRSPSPARKRFFAGRSEFSPMNHGRSPTRRSLSPFDYRARQHLNNSYYEMHEDPRSIMQYGSPDTMAATRSEFESTSMGFENREFDNRFQEKPSFKRPFEGKAPVDRQLNEIPSLFERNYAPTPPVLDRKNEEKSPSFERSYEEIPVDHYTEEVVPPTSSQLKSTDMPIPEFDPDTSKINVHEWMHIFNRVAHESNWSLDDKKFHFANKLGGNARRWFINSKMTDEKWGTIKAAFKKAFPSEMHFYEQLTTMINRTKSNDESMSTYFYHKIALINECGFSGKKAVSCLIGGLNRSKIRGIALRQEFSTPEDLYTFLSNDQISEEEKKECTICKHSNHSAKNCLHKAKKDRTMLNVQGEMYKVVLVNKYVVDAFVNEHKIMGYVSMDSNYVTVRQEDAWSLKLEFETSSKVLRYFGKNNIKAIAVGRAKVQIDKGCVDIDIYVVSNVNQVIPLVIGKSFSHHSQISYSVDDDGVHYYNVKNNSRSKNNQQPVKDWQQPSSSSSSYHNPYI